MIMINEAAVLEAAALKVLHRVDRKPFISNLLRYHVWQIIKVGIRNISLLHLQQWRLTAWTFHPFRKQVRYSERNGVEKPLSQHTMLSGQWPFEKCPSACYLFKLLIVSEWSQRAKKLSVRVTCDTNQTQMSFLWFNSKAAFQASVTHWTQAAFTVCSYWNITANISHNCVTTLVTLREKEGEHRFALIWAYTVRF